MVIGSPRSQHSLYLLLWVSSDLTRQPAEAEAHMSPLRSGHILLEKGIITNLKLKLGFCSNNLTISSLSNLFLFRKHGINAKILVCSYFHSLERVGRLKSLEN